QSRQSGRHHFGRRRRAAKMIAAGPQFRICLFFSGEAVMKRLGIFCAALFLLFSHGIARSVECTVCDKNLSDCRTPAHTQYVSCMKGGSNRSGSTNCSTKCAADCKNNQALQKCTLDCVKACQGGATCQSTYTTASTQCTNTYRTCKKDCTASR